MAIHYSLNWLWMTSMSGSVWISWESVGNSKLWGTQTTFFSTCQIWQLYHYTVLLSRKTFWVPQVVGGIVGKTASMISCNCETTAKWIAFFQLLYCWSSSSNEGNTHCSCVLLMTIIIGVLLPSYLFKFQYIGWMNAFQIYKLRKKKDTIS